MPFVLFGCAFEGLFDSPSNLGRQSGLVLLLDPQMVVVDVIEDSNVFRYMQAHWGNDCWQRNGVSYLAVHYTGAYKRQQLREHIRQRYRPPCGRVANGL